MMEVRDLGVMEYRDAWALQRQLRQRRAEGAIADVLLLVEHPPVFTTGSTAVGLSSALPHPVHAVERGGDATYHGPGQLVGYPIVHLGEAGLGVRAYLRLLEDILIDAAAALGLKAEAIPGFTGVWASGKKIASIGVAVSRRVASHGFALNVDMDLAPFRLINPCRLQPEEISTLARRLGRPVPMAEAKRQVALTFSRRWENNPAQATGVRH